MPPGPIISLASPLSEGRYQVINGGATTAINAHADALDQSILAHRAYWGTAYGVDFVAIDSYGLRANGIMPSDPRRYRIFGMAVVAPCVRNQQTNKSIEYPLGTTCQHWSGRRWTLSACAVQHKRVRPNHGI